MVRLEHRPAGRVGTIPQTENFRGSDAVSDVITLANTQKSTKELVTVNGVVQTITEDYTVSHKSSSSTITFTYALAAEDFITVRYFV